jgi:sec-independent protein translocase protein TatA
MGGLTGWHALIVLAIVVLIFGAAKLPGLAKSVGQSMKIFKNEIKSDEPAKADPSAPAAPQVNQTSAEVAAQQARSRNDSASS